MAPRATDPAISYLHRSLSFMTTSKTKKDCPPLEIVYMYEYNMLEISIFSTAVSFLLEKKQNESPCHTHIYL